VRALVIDGPKSARVRQVDAPVPGPGQAVVDVHRVGICVTDIELFTGELPYFRCESGHHHVREPA
jgi:threonine dehydrogenase-like Zn-dependent dehydrogenase